MSVITRFEVFRMRSSVHIDCSKRVRTADIHDENALQVLQLHEFHSVRSQELPGPARWLPSRVRFKLIRTPIRQQSSRPILKWKLVRLWRRRLTGGSPRARQPDAGFSRDWSKQDATGRAG